MVGVLSRMVEPGAGWRFVTVGAVFGCQSTMPSAPESVSGLAPEPLGLMVRIPDSLLNAIFLPSGEKAGSVSRARLLVSPVWSETDGHGRVGSSSAVG
jgi:hypothetical protein